MAATLHEYYNTNDDSSIPAYLHPTNGLRQLAQTFTVGNVGANEEHTIGSVKILIYRVATPGTVNVYIYATSGGEPIGSVLSSGSFDGDTLTTDSGGEWKEVTMSAYNLQANTQYAIIITAPDGDASNTARWRGDSSSPTYAGGNYLFRYVGDSWSADTGWDMMFEIWGEVVSGTTGMMTCNTGYWGAI